MTKQEYMTKQEFLAMSLSKGLVLQSPYGFRPNGKESTGIFRLVYLTGDLYADIENKTFPEEFIPVCRPLSDLTKPIEHKGEKFVPIVKLLKNSSFDTSKMSEEEIMSFVDAYSNIDLITLNDLPLYLEWHFDLFGGIESGEAINVNTLEINPYK